jgi:FkbM family methyltransferase
MSFLRKFLRFSTKSGLNSEAQRLAEEHELRHLEPILRTLPQELKVAVDVGAHLGSVTRILAAWGFKVYALEPCPEVRKRLISAVKDFTRSGRVQVLEYAASDADGWAQMFVGVADTLNSLNHEWTVVAFPEYFRSVSTVEVPTRRLSTLLRELGVKTIGYLKIDVEGHEPSVLKGLFTDQDAVEPPAIVMFEANQRFVEKAEECLDILSSNGYGQFDIFIKHGPDLLAAARFEGSRLPKEWRPYGEKYFYANIIAYHSEFLADTVLPELPTL